MECFLLFLLILIFDVVVVAYFRQHRLSWFKERRRYSGSATVAYSELGADFAVGGEG